MLDVTNVSESTRGVGKGRRYRLLCGTYNAWTAANKPALSSTGTATSTQASPRALLLCHKPPAAVAAAASAVASAGAAAAAAKAGAAAAAAKAGAAAVATAASALQSRGLTAMDGLCMECVLRW